MLNRFLNWWPLEKLEGYESPELIDVIFRKTVAYEPQGSWPEIADAKTVLDFGGGCGLHYKQARLPSVRWAIVETSAMVAKASEIQTGRLKFFTDIGSAANWLGDIDVMHSNGAIQYAQDPISTLAELCSLGAKKMLWYRTNLATDRLEKDTQVSRLADNGPGTIGGIRKKFVSVTVTRIPEASFLDHHREYRLDERGENWFRFLRKS